MTGRLVSNREKRSLCVLAATIGNQSEAARRLGLNESSARVWIQMYRKDPTCFGSDDDDETLMEEVLDRFSAESVEQVEREARERVRDLMRRGKALEAQRLTTTWGVAVDKIVKLRQLPPEQFDVEAQR